MPPVAVISVCPRPLSRSARSAAPSLVQLREHVVEQKKWRRRAAVGDQLRLREQEREHGQPLLSLRAVAAQVAPAGADPDLVQMRPEPGRAPLEILLEPRLESLGARRLGLVQQPRRRPVRALRPVRRTAAAAPRPPRVARQTSAAPSSATRCVQGATASRDDAPNVTRRSAAFRCATAAPYLGRKASPSGQKPTERAVEVRPPGSRAALDHDEPVRA